MYFPFHPFHPTFDNKNFTIPLLLINVISSTTEAWLHGVYLLFCLPEFTSN